MGRIARHLGGAILAGAMGLAVPTPALSQVNAGYIRSWKLMERAADIKPRPPSGPVRPLNINDIEVREIEAAATKVLPGAIVNIGPVRTGCACEDGPKCTDQVWVLASTSSATKGMLFSRINGTWDLGPVQKWWVEYEKLNGRRRSFARQSEFYEAQRRLLEQMPLCSAYK